MTMKDSKGRGGGTSRPVSCEFFYCLCNIYIYREEKFTAFVVTYRSKRVENVGRRNNRLRVTLVTISLTEPPY